MADRKITFFDRQVIIGDGSAIYSGIHDLHGVQTLVCELQIYTKSPSAGTITSDLMATDDPKLSPDSWTEAVSRAIAGLGNVKSVVTDPGRFFRANFTIPTGVIATVSYAGIARD